MPNAPQDPNQFGQSVFSVLTEVGIIAQLSRNVLETRAPDGLNMPMFGVLNHLCRVDDQPTPLSLARAFQQPKTSMTHTLASLEKRDFIVMVPNPEDGRSKLVQLTVAGRTARGQVITALLQEYADLADVVGIEKIAEILPVLSDIRQYFDRKRDQ